MPLNGKNLSDAVIAALGIEETEGLEEARVQLEKFWIAWVDYVAGNAEWGEKWGETAVPYAESPAPAILTVPVTFPTPYPDGTAYVVVFSFKNTTDGTITQLSGSITAQAAAGFGVTILSPADSANYKMTWHAKASAPA